MLTLIEIDCYKPKKRWMCRCDCGKIISIDQGRIGIQKSCGCIKSKVAIENGKKCTTHGDTNTRLYRIWGGMRRRCYEEQNKDYKNYGERGIVVCDEWLEYFNFKEWAIQNGYNDKLTIDRIDVNGNYCPKNCRWVDMIAQNNNRRSNHILEYNGESHTIAEWSRITNIPPKTIRYRICAGWSIKDALTFEVTKSNCSLVSRLARVS